MKKTLITLLACGGIAQAELSLLATDKYTCTWEESITDAAVTLILSKVIMTKLDTAATINQVFATFDVTGISASSYSNLNETISFESTVYTVNSAKTNAIRLSTSNVPTTFVQNPNFTFFTTSHYANQQAWDTAEYAALTFGIGYSNKQPFTRAVLSVISADGTITNITQASNNNKIAFTGISELTLNEETTDNTYIYSGTWDNAALTTITERALRASLIPEPTTATLSLLALAGLAARRRRR